MTQLSFHSKTSCWLGPHGHHSKSCRTPFSCHVFEKVLRETKNVKRMGNSREPFLNVVMVYMPHTSHPVSGMFAILSLVWDRTSACKGASLAAAMSPYLISSTHPTHAWMWKKGGHTQHRGSPPYSPRTVCGFFNVPQCRLLNRKVVRRDLQF